MARDNFSMLFAAAPSSAPPTNANASNSSNGNDAVATTFPESSGNDERNQNVRLAGNELPTPQANNDDDGGGVLLRGFSSSSSDVPVSPSEPLGAPTPITTDDSHNTPKQPPIQNTRPGTESIQYLKKFGSNIGSMALKPLRELQLAEKLNSMNAEIEEMQNEKEAERLRRQLELEEQDKKVRSQADPVAGGRRLDDELEEQSEQLAMKLQAEEEEEECERIKIEADMACQRVAQRYNALVKFTSSCPRGTYEEFVEFLLMGGGRSENDIEGTEDDLLFENFYDENSEYRRLWNDNLTMGMPETASTVEGRVFVPAVSSSNNSGGDDTLDPWHHLSPTGGSGSSGQRRRTFSEDERLRNFGQTLRERTVSEGERIKKQIGQVDRGKIKQGLGSAVNAISSVSSFALKPLRELQLAEKLNAMNLDMEDEEAQKEIEQYNRMQEEKKDLEEMMRIKREAEESCMNATKEHLLSFIKDNPNARYHEWIEDLHPENAHDGTLLEGLGKTIDHRFYVEESDHRILWNENLFTYLDPNISAGRDYVPARARQMNDNGEMVTAADILSGSAVGGGDDNLQNCAGEESINATGSSDLIAFD